MNNSFENWLESTGYLATDDEKKDINSFYSRAENEYNQILARNHSISWEWLDSISFEFSAQVGAKMTVGDTTYTKVAHGEWV